MKNNCFHRATLVVATSLLTLTASADLAISDVAGLKAFRDAVNAGNTYSGQTVYLTTDIDLNNESWTPIANTTDDNASGFQGTFDGRGYKISNLNVNIYQSGDWNYAISGLFAINSGTIKNLFIYNPTIKASTQQNRSNSCCAGTICGINKGIISNCCVYGGSVYTYCGYGASGSNGGFAESSGIANAYNNNCTISNCYITGTSISAEVYMDWNHPKQERTDNIACIWKNRNNNYSSTSNCDNSTTYAANWRMNRNYAAWLNNNIYGFENTDEPYTWDEDGITPEKHYSANISNALAEGIRDGYIVVSPTIPNTYKRNDGIVDVYSVDYNGANYMLYPEGTTVNVKVALEGWDLNTKNEQNEVTKAGWFIDKIYFTYDYTQNGNSAYEVGNEIAIRTNADGSAYEIGIPEEVNSATGRILREQGFSFTTPSGPTTVLYTTTNYDGLITSVDNVKMPIEISVEDNNIIAPADAEIYNINGVRVNNENLQSGIYVVRLGKQVKKIVVK